MTYVTLYRKYRPKNFSEVIGQEHVTRTLINALKAGKASHAYLFAGPRGTGKTSIAKILAKALNCQNRGERREARVKGDTLGKAKDVPKSVNGQPRQKQRDKRSTVNEPVEPCNECTSCNSVDSNSSVDVLEIDAASNRGIDEIRNLRERVHFAPSTKAGKKVFIIDEVHMLTTEAFNALLKMIEEPPEHAVFILATTELHKVIPTIVSRCQRFDFRRILAQDIVGRLKYIANQEGFTVEESTLGVIARQAQGSVRDSIGLLDQLAAFADKKITAEVVTQVLNLTESELLFELTDFILKKDTLGCLNFINELMDKGFDLRQFTAELIGHFRSITIALAAKDPVDIIHTTPENLGRIQSQASQFQIFEAVKIIDLLSDTYRQMRFSADVRLLLEIALIKLTKLESDVSLEGLLYRVEELEKAVRSAKSEVRSEKNDVGRVLRTRQKKEKGGTLDKDKDVPKSVNRQPSTVNDKIHRVWPIVMQQIKQESIPLYSLMLECHPVQTSDSIITLMFNRAAAFHLKEVTKNSNVVKKVLKNVTGTELEIECDLDDSASNLTEEKDQDENISADHVIKMMQEDLGAEVIETMEKDDS